MPVERGRDAMGSPGTDLSTPLVAPAVSADPSLVKWLDVPAEELGGLLEGQVGRRQDQVGGVQLVIAHARAVVADEAQQRVVVRAEAVLLAAFNQAHDRLLELVQLP